MRWAERTPGVEALLRHPLVAAARHRCSGFAITAVNALGAVFINKTRLRIKVAILVGSEKLTKVFPVSHVINGRVAIRRVPCSSSHQEHDRTHRVNGPGRAPLFAELGTMRARYTVRAANTRVGAASRAARRVADSQKLYRSPVSCSFVLRHRGLKSTSVSG